MKLPFVSRERYEEALLREARLEGKLERLMEHLFATVDKMVEASIEPQIVHEDNLPPAFAFPPEVTAAVSERSRPGSQQAIGLFDWARGMLEGGEMDPEEVAARILAGDDTLGTGW